jgi:SulP family sulfate permease
VDLKHELYLNSAANLLGGACGAHTGYTALSLTMLGPKTGSDSRLVGLSAALLTGAATFFGASVLGNFPRFILGGVVLFLGVATLLDWLMYVRRQLTRVEYAMILAILLTIGLFGFLPGVGVGLGMATVVFVVKYSRLPVVRQDTDATALSSTRLRSVPDQHILREQGQSVRILRVMGYLFFGSANILSRSVAAHLKPDAGPPPSHLILDFLEVDGFDSSAVNCFLRMLQRCAAAGCQIVFSATPPTLEDQLRRAEPLEADRARFFADLDRALEFCEDAVLERDLASSPARADEAGRSNLFESAVDDLLLRLEESERFEALLTRLGPHLAHRQALAGEVIVRQGDATDGVYLFVSGQAEELFEDETAAATRLRSLGPGSMAGQLATWQGHRAPGSILARTDCSLSLLSAAALRHLETTDPPAALAFYSLFSAQLEARLAQSASAKG